MEKSENNLVDDDQIIQLALDKGLISKTELDQPRNHRDMTKAKPTAASTDEQNTGFRRRLRTPYTRRRH